MWFHHESAVTAHLPRQHFHSLNGAACLLSRGCGSSGSDLPSLKLVLPHFAWIRMHLLIPGQAPGTAILRAGRLASGPREGSAPLPR